jgi:hypothetical protein
MATDVQTQLKQVEAAVAANAAEFSKEAPAEYAKMKKVLEALKKAPPGKAASAEVKGLVVDLVRWQFDMQLKDFRAQYAQVKKEADASGDPAIEKVALALNEVVGFLTEAKAVDFPPSPKALAALEARNAKLKKAFAVAAEAASRSTMNIPMRTLKKPIVSPGGVPLKAVSPPPRAAAKSAGTGATRVPGQVPMGRPFKKPSK